MRNNGLNILFTTAHYPYPLIGGDKIKQYHILKHLAKDHNIFVVSFDRWYPIEMEHISEFEKLGIKTYPIKMNNYKAYMSGLIHSPFGHPLEIEFFRDNRFTESVLKIVNEKRIDLAINYFLRTTEYIRNLNCKKILLAEDCRSHFQARTSRESSNLKQKLIRFYESKKLKKYEADITNSFDITTLVTDEDVFEMKKLNPAADIRKLSNGVDIIKFSPPKDNTTRRDLVFTSKLDMWVNDLMLTRITDIIFPLILKRCPDAKLHIVGASPKKKHRLIQSDNILLHANVPEITPYLQNAAVYLHPHVGGSGIQNKVLEALACGCPVITTYSGARGINFKNGTEGFITDSYQEMADTAVKLLNDVALVNEISRNARNFILKNFQWSRINHELDNIIEELINQNT